MGNIKVLAVIPARYASTRFEGKPLANLKGKPVIVRVVEQTLKCETVDKTVVATDDERIAEAVRAAGHEAVMTSKDHLSGTDRVAEVASGSNAEIVVNVQGDEPMIDPASIDAAVRALLENPELGVSTLCVNITDEAEYRSSDVVKVVTDNNGMALYFSRAPIPHDRDGAGNVPMKKHLGLYAYRRKFLLKYAALKPTPLEMTERLEQLRILQYGYRIMVVEGSKDSIGIDTPEDLKKAEVLLDA